MTRIKPVELSEAKGKTRELLEAINKQFGTVPNIFKGFAHSPAVLEFYLGQVKSLSAGVLNPKLREQIAVAVAGANECNYCASAHTFLGKRAGVSPEELAANLSGRSENRKTELALDFTRTVVENRGRSDETDLQRLRDGGFSEAEIVEIIAHVGMNLFTNYFNHIAATEVDFPLVQTTRMATTV